MRKLQALPSPAQFDPLSKSGRIALTILLIIVAVLIYNKADAKEENYKNVFIKNELNSGIESILKTEVSARKCPDTEIAKKRFKNQLNIHENEKVFYRISTFKSQRQSRLDQPKNLTGHEITKLKSSIKKNAVIIDEELLKDVENELKGTLMEPMIIHIASLDRETAALMVGIAKIESGYRHNYSYNFWGYAGGYYGFSSPKQAVDVVGTRINELRNQGLNTPSKIVTTWKCGRSCASHPPESVQRWVSTVSGPYSRIAMK